MQVPYRKEVPMFNKLIYFVYETVNQDTEVFVVVKNINQSSICISFVQVACIFLFLAFQKAIWYRFCQTITSFCSLALVGLFVCLFVFFCILSISEMKQILSITFILKISSILAQKF